MLEKDMAQLPNSDMPLPAGDRDSNDANVLLNRYARLVRETVDRTSRMSDAEVRRRGIQGPDPRVGRNGSVESSVFEQVSRIPRHLQDHLNQARNNLSAYAARAHAPG
jgi:hypothetical protein